MSEAEKDIAGEPTAEDQATRLHQHQVKLTKIYLEELDPDLWPGAALGHNERSREQRGDRQWSMNNVRAVGTLLLQSYDIQEKFGANPDNPELRKLLEEAGAKAAEKFDELARRRDFLGKNKRPS